MKYLHMYDLIPFHIFLMLQPGPLKLKISFRILYGLSWKSNIVVLGTDTNTTWLLINKDTDNRYWEQVYVFYKI